MKITFIGEWQNRDKTKPSYRNVKCDFACEQERESNGKIHRWADR